MKFSVTIPAYKSRYLGEAVGSVVSQTFADWELIIVDDCSPEDLRTVVSPYLTDSRISYYRNERNCGAVDVVDNWNRCLDYCTGDYVICIGDDDRLLPCCLEEYAALINKHPGLHVYHARTQIINAEGQVVNLQEPRPEHESVLSLIWNRWASRNKQYIGDFCYDTKYLKQEGGYYKLPLAWGSDDVTAAKAADGLGIANTQAFCFQYRENPLTISSTTSHARLKIESTLAQYDWFAAFLENIDRSKLTPADSDYLLTIATPRQEYYRNSLAKDCIDYMKGNPLRLAWCRRQLRRLNYPGTTILKWYLKSMGL